MNAQVMDLKRIIDHQMINYQAIYELEEAKTSAIHEKDGKAIEDISLKQEKIIKEIESLEKERMYQIDCYRIQNRLDDLNQALSLSDLIRSMDEDSGHQLYQRGFELKKLIGKMRRLIETNEVLLKDNLEFFRILVSGLRDSSTVKSGYGSDGREESTLANPVMINHTA